MTVFAWNLSTATSYHFNKILLMGIRYLLNGRGRRRLKCNFFAQNTYNVLKHKYAKIFYLKPPNQTAEFQVERRLLCFLQIILQLIN